MRDDGLDGDDDTPRRVQRTITYNVGWGVLVGLVLIIAVLVLVAVAVLTRDRDDAVTVCAPPAATTEWPVVCRVVQPEDLDR